MPYPTGHNIDDVLAAINGTPDANTGDPIADAMTWESLGPDLSHPAADVPTPHEEPAPLPTKGSVAGPKVSASFRGITPEGTKKAKGFFGEADQRIASREAEAAGVANDEIAHSRAHISAVGDALDFAVQKTTEFQQREQDLQHQVIDFNRGAADVEARSAAMAQAERQAYITQYKEQLGVVRQLALQSGNPMTQMSKPESVGLAGAQFAQGFLAAQGIHIDVAGQVDRWVERSIQEHQMKVQNARTSAEDQLHLYDISRQNSQDEWEARQRYRGFVITGLQTAIQLNASRFQSDIAMARAQEQIARLQVEADATERSIADKHFDRVNQIMTTENQRAFQMGTLSIEQKKAAVEAQKASWDMDPRNPKNAKGEKGFMLPPISDPENLGPDGKPLVDANGNKILRNRWQINPGVAADPVLARDVWKQGAEARENYAHYLDSTNKMMQAYGEAKKMKDSLHGPFSDSWEAAARLDDTGKVQAFLQARDAWAMAKVYNDSGKAATDVEYKRQQNQAYVDKWLAHNGEKGEQSHAQLREDGRLKFERNLESYGFTEVPETDATGAPNGQQFARTPTASPRTGAQDEEILNGQTAIPGTVEKLEGKATAKESDEQQRPYNQVSGVWADFKNVDFKKLKGAKISDDAKGYLEQQGQSEGAVAVELLAAAYARPHFFYKHASEYGVNVGQTGRGNDETPAEIRKGSYKALSDLAAGNAPNGGSVSADLMDWAAYLKRGLDNDQELAGAMNHDNDVTDSPFAKRLAERPGSN